MGLFVVPPTRVFVLVAASFPPPSFLDEQTSTLFDAAKKAEDQIASISEENDRNRLSKGGFFMLCALGTANFSRVSKSSMTDRLLYLWSVGRAFVPKESISGICDQRRR